jgi:hypothetical protein
LHTGSRLVVSGDVVGENRERLNGMVSFGVINVLELDSDDAYTTL